jgi:MFS family permease
MFRNVSKIIWSLVSLDLTLFWGWGLVGPILAIFITREIGASISQAGLAAALTFATQAILQLFVGLRLDRTRGEEDDYNALFFSIFLAGFVGLGFFFARELWHIFALQIAQGVRNAFYYASWPPIFSRHLDRGRESFEWSLDLTGVGFANAFAIAIGAYLAETFGFRFVFLVVSLLSFLSLVPLFFARSYLIRK